MATSSERAFGMTLALRDLAKDRESSLADGYLYRFGQFALDSRKRTVSRAGSPVSLTPKAFDVLLFLAQNPNRLVTKEELLEAVWGDTFVEEGNLTQYISHLRKALADNLDDNRLIVTIARKGYQFTARVTVAEAADIPKHATLQATATETSKTDARPVEFRTKEKVTNSPPARRRLLTWTAAAALLLIGASGIWIYSRVRGNVAFSAADTVILVVTNRTGDAVFDDALYTALRVGLEQTPYLNVLADNKVRGAMQSLNLQPGAKLTPEIARQVCLSTNSRMVVASSIADAGNGFRIEIAGIDCQSGITVTRVQEDAVSRNEIVRVLGLSAVRLRAALGEPRASIARFNKPLEEATSSSPEALQLLTEGYRRHLAGNPLEALPYYKRATDADPEFALAYGALGLAYKSSGDFASAAAAEKKTFELRNRMTEVTRFHAENLYYDLATGEEDKACSVAWEWVQTFPQDFIAHTNFALCLEYLGQPDHALAESREAARLLPSALSYWNWILRSILVDRFDEAAAIFNEADKRKFDGTELRSQRLLLAFLRKDPRALQEQLDWATAKPHAAPSMLYQRSEVDAYYGRFRESRSMREQAAAHGGSPPLAADYGLLSEVEVGNTIPARRGATDALKRGPNRDGQLVLAFVFARAGDIEQARKLVDTVSQSAPSATLVQNYCLPTIQAAIRLDQHDPAAAVEILGAAAKYDLSNTDCLEDLHPAYIRGLAYLQLHQGRRAAVEFQKLVDHPGLVGSDVIGALARLQLGRAYEIMGDQATARRWYEEFLTIWKDADPDIPILKQAKAEFAKLH
jgi:DNA-binding winged helix-turn-helix (wHTH) protein/Flp pilus assembly protein TadD